MGDIELSSPRMANGPFFSDTYSYTDYYIRLIFNISKVRQKLL